MSDLPSVPSIPGNVDAQLYQVLSAIKQNIDAAQINAPVTQDILATAISTAIATVPAGQQGTDGLPGDSYVLDITGGRTSVIYDANGANPLPVMSAFGFLLYKNGVAITTGLTFSWYISNPGGSLLSGTGTSSTFTPTLASTFDAAKADNTVTLSVTYGGLTITAKEPIAITKIGAIGNNSASFSIDNAGSAFSKNAGGTISPSLGIALTTYTQNITSPTYQWKLNGVNIAGETAASYTVPTLDYSAVITNTYKCTVTGIINGVSGSTLNDTITIPLLVDGTSAPTVILSNENMTFPGPVSGYTGITFTGGNCNITAYIGSVALSYGTTGALTFSCTNSSIGATVAGGIGSASTYAVLAPTAMSTDIATTDVVITIRDALGNVLSSITKRISYSLSRLGSTGLTGSAGTNGTNGINGASLYTWLKYADTPTTGMSDLPTGKTYMGIAYNKTVATESTVYADYDWSLIKGTDGIAGVAGTNTYTWVKYGTSAVGAGINDSPTGMTYIGLAFNKTTATESVITTDYTWSLIQGATGKSYVLFITGGITNAIYDTAGINPLPAQTAFSCELYEDGVLKTPATYAWSVSSTNTLLTGSSTTATFTPTLAATFDRTKGDNRVLLTATYAGITVKAVQPIVMTSLVLAAVDMTAPVAISGLTVTGGILYNYLDWGTLPGNFDHVEVWRSGTNDRTVAALIGTSLFTVYADYIPSGVNTTYYYWIRAISKAGVAGAWNAVSSAGTSASPQGIGDSQVNSISATKIFALTLSALTANLGDVTAGTLKSPDQRFIIDLVNKEIIIASSSANPSNSWSGGNYIKIKNGSVDTYVWNGAIHVIAKSLSVLEVGSANNGATVSLAKYYATQPQVIVSPKNLQSYNATYTSVSQTLIISADNIIESTPGSGSWQFTVNAQLALSNGTSSTSPNEAIGPSATTPLTSSVYVTPALTTAITVSVDLTSARGTGTAPTYYNRTVTYYLYVRIHLSGSAYTLVGTQTVALGATLSAVTSTLTSSALASNSWDVYVTASYSDAGGTFTSGTGGYTYYADQTVNLASDGALVDTGNVSVSYINSPIVCPSFPAFTVQTGYSVYNVAWTIKYGYYLYQSGFGAGATLYEAGTSIAGTSTSTPTRGTLNVPSSTATRSYTSSTYATTTDPLLSVQAAGSAGQFAKAQGKIFATGSIAVISQRMAITNSATASNTLKFNSYTSTLSGASTLATGSLNWQAIL
jgi:hypothetical protein